MRSQGARCGNNHSDPSRRSIVLRYHSLRRIFFMWEGPHPSTHTTLANATVRAQRGSHSPHPTWSVCVSVCFIRSHYTCITHSADEKTENRPFGWPRVFSLLCNRNPVGTPPTHNRTCWKGIRPAGVPARRHATVAAYRRGPQKRGLKSSLPWAESIHEITQRSPSGRKAARVGDSPSPNAPDSMASQSRRPSWRLDCWNRGCGPYGWLEDT